MNSESPSQAVAVWQKSGDDSAGDLAALIAYYGVATAVVLGLIAWLYLEAELTLYAVEINVVPTGCGRAASQGHGRRRRGGR